jgi:hypothetical protein
MALMKKKRLFPDAFGLKGINKFPFEYARTGKLINRTVHPLDYPKQSP